MSKAFRIFDKLVDTALGMSVCFPGDQARHFCRPGGNRPIPDNLKPGALLNYLSPEEREELMKLTSKEVQQRSLRPDVIERFMF